MITLRRSGRITACGKCSLLLWLDPTELTRTQAVSGIMR